jgi:hypothetical protein
MLRRTAPPRLLHRTTLIIGCLAVLLGLNAITTTQVARARTRPAAAATQYTPPDDAHPHLVPNSHRCVRLGDDDFGNVGVSCAESVAARAAGGEVVIGGQNEVYCQDWTGKVIECAAIRETVSVCQQRNGQVFCPVSANAPGACGARLGHTPCGARRVVNLSADTLSVLNGCLDVWGESFGPQIVLPQSNKAVGGSGINVAAFHAPNVVVCG